MEEDVIDLLKHYTFDVEDNQQHLLCQLCGKILINAMSVPCSCIFCYNCIRDYLKDDNKTCPGSKEKCQATVLSFSRNILCYNKANTEILNLTVRCPNESCVERVSIKTLVKHLRECCKIADYEKRVLEGCGMNEAVPDFVGDLSACDNRIAEVQNAGTEKEKRTDVERELADQRQQLTTIAEQQSTIKASLQRHIEESRLDMERIRKLLQEVEQRQVNSRKVVDTMWARLNEFVWIIERVSSKYQNSLSEYSNPFLSDKSEGYKMCLYFYISTHFGLYLTFVFMRDKRDDHLPWPMRRTVQLDIIDQDVNKPVVSQQFSVSSADTRIDPNYRKAAYNKPKQECSDGISQSDGYVQFKTFVELQNMGAIRNDRLLVQCRVLP